ALLRDDDFGAERAQGLEFTEPSYRQRRELEPGRLFRITVSVQKREHDMNCADAWNVPSLQECYGRLARKAPTPAEIATRMQMHQRDAEGGKPIRKVLRGTP